MGRPLRWPRRARRDASGSTFYLIGAAGIPNFGDEAIARYWIAYLRARYPGCRIVLDGCDGGVATLLHPGVDCVDHVWWLAREAGAQDPRVTRERLRARWASETVLPMRERQLLELARSTTAMHVLGGGYVNDVWAENRNLLAVCAALADRSGVRVFATGLGLEPMSAPSAAALAGVLDAFVHVDLRDVPSERALKAHLAPAVLGRLSVLGDDLLQADVTALVTVRDGPPRLHVCLQDEFFDDPAAAARTRAWVVDQARAFRAEHPGAPVVCWELRPVSDAVVWSRLREALSGVELVPFERVWAQGLIFGRRDRLLASRFHFQLLAAAAGLDGTALSWCGYYDTKHASLRSFSRWELRRLAGEEVTAIRFAEPPRAPERAEAIGRRKRAFVDRVLYPAPAAAWRSCAASGGRGLRWRLGRR